ncbi:MAG: hypothetical protein ACLR1V_05150 [Coprococcus sp.]
MMAYKEKMLKKRLAYSTVSQVSYILFGLSVMQPIAFVGASDACDFPFAGQEYALCICRCDYL